jgi:MerR family copper efflux transcriptional regulator
MNPRTPPAATQGAPANRPGIGIGIGIEEAMARAGVSQRLVRQCEALGLLSAAEDTEARAARYTHDDIHVLRFVRRAHALGFGMNDVARLLALWRKEHRACADVKHIALSRAEELDAQIESLQATKRLLERLADLYLGDHQPECPILDELLALKGFAAGPLSSSV